MRNWCYQIFQGLAYIHKHGFFHRDMKPGGCGAPGVRGHVADVGRSPRGCVSSNGSGRRVALVVTAGIAYCQ